MRVHPGWVDPDGLQRDHLGRRVLGSGQETLLVVGDSVPAGGLADVAAEAALGCIGGFGRLRVELVNAAQASLGEDWRCEPVTVGVGAVEVPQPGCTRVAP